jgi:glycosyltransferase involved in cell wall biosynthesis
MKLTIVTPTFNVAPYIEETIKSVVSQGVEDIEYIIVDGKSTDGTLDKINQYADKISRIISEPDHGTYDAVNKGFSLSSGEIMGWIGGDDYYTKGSLHTVLKTFAQNPGIEWMSSRSSMVADEHGQLILCGSRGGFSKNAFLDGCHTECINHYGAGFINQESTFWRRSLWERAGSRVATEWSLAADFELWARFFCLAEIAYVQQPLSVFRLRPNQNSRINYQKYVAQAAEILQVYRVRENYTVAPSQANGLRVYQGNYITNGQLVRSDFVYLDPQGTLGRLKPLIANGLIS